MRLSWNNVIVFLAMLHKCVCKEVKVYAQFVSEQNFRQRRDSLR